MDRPPANIRSGRTLVAATNEAASLFTAETRTAGRSGARRPARRYGKSMRLTAMPAELAVRSIATRPAWSLPAPAPGARSSPNCPLGAPLATANDPSVSPSPKAEISGQWLQVALGAHDPPAKELVLARAGLVSMPASSTVLRGARRSYRSQPFSPPAKRPSLQRSPSTLGSRPGTSAALLASARM
jgi:hypothetical protein